MQDIESIKQIVGGEPAKFDGDGFTRHINFTACGVDYTIKWWINQSYLTCGKKYSNYVPFTQVEKDSCWPCYSKGLKFYDGDTPVMYIATKLLDWQEEKG